MIYLISISFTAACTNGRVTSLGPRPTHTIVPPGFLEYMPVHKLKYQENFNVACSKTMIVLKNQNLARIQYPTLYYLDAAPEHSIVASAW